MRKVFLTTLVAVFMAGASVQACGGMFELIRQLGSLQEAIAAIREAGSTQAALDELNNPQPEQEPPPPPPPVFVNLPPDSLELWDGREVIATPELAAPIQLEETVVIS